MVRVPNAAVWERYLEELLAASRSTGAAAGRDQLGAGGTTDRMSRDT